MTNRQWREYLTWFIEARREEIFASFAELPGAIGSQHQGYVFVPGSDAPEKRVLLVAHADTVWDQKKDSPRIRANWDGNICTGFAANIGLGADDRAGCAMLWNFKDSGASLLLTDDEEVGCIGARAAVGAIPDLLKQHIFGIQMDRRGDMQAVFYEAASYQFEKWLVDKLMEIDDGWRRVWGSFSDVAVIGPEVKLNCVNLSAGFLKEHTISEMLVLDAWLGSIEAVQELLRVAQAGLVPELPPPRERPYISRHSSKGRNGLRLISGGKDWKPEPAPWKKTGETREQYWTRVAKEQNWKKEWLEAVLTEKESKKERRKGKGSQRHRQPKGSAMAAMVEIDWHELTRKDRKRACREAEDLGWEVVLEDRAASDDPPSLVYFAEVVEKAFATGELDADAMGKWEKMLVFDNDCTDPRVRALERGMMNADDVDSELAASLVH
jgi:hypothetical protein